MRRGDKRRRPAAARSPRGGGGAPVAPSGQRGAVRLDASQVRWRCDPVEASKQRPKVSRLLGQPRALAALRTGLELYAPGYNVFLSGLLGSGRTRVVRHLIEELQPACRLRPDRVYVHNFRDPNRPRLLALPRGKAREFRDDVAELVFGVRDALREALGSRRHKAARKEVVQVAERRQRRMFDALARVAGRVGLELVEYRDGAQHSADVLPVHDGKPRPLDELERLVRDGEVDAQQRDVLLQARADMVERLEDVSQAIRVLHRRTEAELRVLERDAARHAIEPLLAEFGDRWDDHAVRAHVAELGDAILADLPRWLADDDGGERATAEPLRPHPTPLLGDRFRDFRVLVLSRDVTPDSGCPVVVEGNPTYNSLFGTIDPAQDGPQWLIGRIHVGALFQADGGYLIVRARDVLAEPGVWLQLKRALKAGRVDVREYDPTAGTTAGDLQPEGIELDLKIVMIGEPGLYEQLVAEDPQFKVLFKVHAEFDSTIANDAANRRRYADFLAWLCESENLGAIASDATAAIAEHGARLAGRQDRLSTCFGELADVAREAAYLAGGGPVERSHVDQAIAARDERADLSREHLDRDLGDGYLLLRTSGRAVGQVNALTVVDNGTFAYGRPMRVTAATGAAPRDRGDLVNIEREAELSGPLHDKGVMILQGFLLDHLGRERPVELAATLCFEQLYSALDGDSASCAELFALLSSLADAPIAQGIAVTGSLNQKGEVQPVGGVNEKIEGFFRACRQRGLGGEQGVLIPAANARDLMLAPDVVAAIEAGEFSVWTMAHAFDGLEILTGTPSDEVLARARDKLDAFRRATGAERAERTE